MTPTRPLLAIFATALLATGAVAQTSAAPIHHPAGKLKTLHARAAAPAACDRPALFVPAGKINSYAPASTGRCAATGIAGTDADRHGAGGAQRLPD